MSDSASEASDTSEAATTGGRRRSGGKAVLVLVIAAAGAAALASATQAWVWIGLADGAAAFSELEVTGQKLNPSLSPVAIAALASALVLTIAGTVFRRVLGVLAVLLGAGIGVLAASALADPRGQSRWAVAEATGISGDAQDELVRSVSTTPWPVLAVACGAILAVAGLLVLLLGGRWRASGRKYEAAAPAAGGASADEPDRIAEWDALSDGDDPT